MENKRVVNWSGLVRATPQTYFRPSTQEEVQSIVRECISQKKHLRVLGSGHSFTSLWETDKWIISIDRLNRIQNIDTVNHRVKVSAGKRLHDLNQELFNHGYALENMGDIDRQTIAGIIATGTHGTGVRYGTLSTVVSELTLVTGNGEILVCSGEQLQRYFKAAQVSLGALGVITDITINILPVFKLKAEKSKIGFDSCLETLNSLINENEHFEFFWFPYTETVQIKTLNTVNDDIINNSLNRLFNEYFLENGIFYLVSHCNRIFPSLSGLICKISAAGSPKDLRIDYSHRIFPTMRLVKFTEMEYSIPIDAVQSAMTEIRKSVLKNNFKVHFPVEVRFVKGDDIFLSPAYGRDSAYISVHMFKGMRHNDYFDAIERILLNYEGRPHWGKMHSLTSEKLATLYPLWNEFLSVRKELDPDGIFVNPYLGRLFGINSSS